MDQISDDRNTDESWLEEIAIKEAMKKLNNREKHIISLRFFQGKLRWKLPMRSAYPKLRSPGWRKPP